MAQAAKRTGSVDMKSWLDPYTRLTKMYERQGLTDWDRMIPYYMNSSSKRFSDLLNNDPAGFKLNVAEPVVADHISRMMDGSESSLAKLLDQSDLYKSLDNDGKKKFMDEVVKGVVEKTWHEPQKYLLREINHMYLVAGFHERRMYTGGGPPDAVMTLGGGEQEKKQNYSTWYGKGQIIRISNEVAPSIYITGEEGTGKTNGGHNLIEEMIANFYWVYTNMPVVSEYGHVFVTKRYSDIYVDTPEMPSILRALQWARKHRIPGGSFLVYDEGGKGAAAKSTTLEGEALRAHLQIRRHYSSGFMQMGIQRMQAKQEAEGLLGYLIETKRIDTGRVNEEKKPIYKFYWDIATRNPKGGTSHEFVYNVPLTRLKLNYANETKLPYALDMDIPNVELLQKAVDFVTTPLDQLIVDLRNHVRETYRPELIGAPVYGEDEDDNAIVRKEEKKELEVALRTPVKKKEADLSPDEIEAIGNMRKAGIKMHQISEEMDIPLPVITGICRQYGWF